MSAVDIRLAFRVPTLHRRAFNPCPRHGDWRGEGSGEQASWNGERLSLSIFLLDGCGPPLFEGHTFLSI